jgi:hypothetical protein
MQPTLALLLPLLPLVAAASLAFVVSPGESAPGGGPGSAAGADEVIVGDGAHKFRWDAGWPKLPDGVALGNTHGNVVVDRQGLVYFNTDSEHAIVVVEPGGKFVRSMGAEWKGGLHGMALVREGEAEFLYIVHLGRHCAAKLTLTGEVVWTLGWPQESGLYEKEGQFNPTAIAVRPDGGFYVADGYGRSWVHEYSQDRKWLRAFGGNGTEPGQMRTPHGLWLDTQAEAPLLVVADRENGRLQRFSLAGELVDVIKADLRRPCSLARRGDVYAVADLTGRVTLVDAQTGALRVHLAEQPDPAKRAQNGIPRADWRAGEFLSPHGVAFGNDGALYVQDWNSLGRVTRMAPVE